MRWISSYFLRPCKQCKRPFLIWISILLQSILGQKEVQKNTFRNASLMTMVWKVANYVAPEVSAIVIYYLLLLILSLALSHCLSEELYIEDIISFILCNPENFPYVLNSFSKKLQMQLSKEIKYRLFIVIF